MFLESEIHKTLLDRDNINNNINKSKNEFAANIDKIFGDDTRETITNDYYKKFNYLLSTDNTVKESDGHIKNKSFWEKIFSIL